ncbi:hypothetical protein J3459_009891 [Metarhizium acridum]|nr:hypothetical protein J3459_009891 [Metarhizium acridum]
MLTHTEREISPHGTKRTSSDDVDAQVAELEALAGPFTNKQSQIQVLNEVTGMKEE